MKKQRIILIGSGGHCKSCIDVIEAENRFHIFGILDLPEKVGENILGYEILGSDTDIPKYANQGFSFLLTIGHMGDPKIRIKLFQNILMNKGLLPVIISPLAYVSKYANIEPGSIIMHHAIVNAGAKIGKNCIINNKVLVEHDVNIKSQTHISTGAIVNGGVEIDEGCFVGSASVIKNNLYISKNIVLGAGTTVTKDLVEKGVYVGCPAVKLK